MSDTYIENAIILAIDIINNHQIAQANFDKTYIGIISKVVDQTTGEYEIKYQDSVLTAYATSPNIYFKVGQEVYFLVPRNNMGNRKSIIGAVDQKATSYKEIPPVIETYNRYGTNIIKNFEEDYGKLSSYKDEENRVLYGADREYNEITLDEKAINNYIKQGNGLAFGMIIRTDLADSQVGGNYGVKFLLSFKNAVTGDAAIRLYVVSSQNVIGNPYVLIKPTEVETFINDINIEEFQRILQISIFNNDFPQDEDKADVYDIFISNIQLYAGKGLTEEALNGYSLNIDASTNGTVLDNEISTTKLIAQLKVQGKIITKDIKYYWFRLNGTIFRGSDKYSSYAGDGWECLNYYQDNSIKIPVAYTTPEFEFNTKKEEEDKDDPGNAKALANQKVNKILCVAVYENLWIKGLITILNNTINININISTKQSLDAILDNPARNIYYLDNGSPTLTCNIDEEGEFNYTWSVIPARGRAEKKEATEKDNADFDTFKADWEQAQKQAEKKDDIGRAKYLQSLLYKTKKEKWEKIKNKERIQDNQYINFPISSINGYSKIVCAITKKLDGTYKGSGSITLYNRTELEGMYSLSLENGTQVFQYDGKGNSPTSPQLEKPLQIKPLTFNLIDNTGKEIPHEQIKNNGHIKWIIPKKQTLLSSVNNGVPQSGLTDPTVLRADIALPADSYDVYWNNDSFNYAVADRYDAKLNINYIWLHVKFKEMEFDTYTDFTFPKDGDPGTNGTDYVAKIAFANNTDRIYISDKASTEIFDDTGALVDKLNFLLYNNSTVIGRTASYWNCPPTTETTVGVDNRSEINTYLQKSNGEDGWQKPELKVIEKTASAIVSDAPVNIIRAQYGTSTEKNALKYFAECPVCTLFVNPGYRLKVKQKTGFKYAVYSNDGTRPDYDNTMPFEIIVEKANDEYWLVDTTARNYTWYIIGNLDFYTTANNTLDIKITLPLDITTRSNTIQNAKQCYFKPKNTFTGENLSSAIAVEVSGVGCIHIPIYMILNRYGHNAINGWDGNSIQLNDKGDIILAPQVGAGKKNTDNTFTGVLMGDIKESTETKTGLVGYHQGQRSIFLDANTGNALFGKQGAAQIKITASSGLGTILSGDYSYPNGKGMKIKFSEDGDGPYIRYGSGRFSVDENGNITAKGGGTIANWKISNDALTSQDDKVYLRSSNYNTSYPYAIYSNGTFSVTPEGFMTSTSGKIAKWSINANAITDGKVGMGQGKTIPANTFDNQTSEITNARIWSGNSTSDTFAVTANGRLYSKSGQIASWSIGQTNLTNGDVGLGLEVIKKSRFSTDNDITAKIWSGEEGSLNFAVDNTGKLYSRAGKIGGWTILNNRLWAVGTSGKGIRLNSNGSMNGGAGYSSGSGGSWAIYEDGSSSFTNITTNHMKATNATVTGDLTANTLTANKSGLIGGWTIKPNSLEGGDLTLYSKGSMYGPNWSITKSGDAYFGNIYGTVKDGKTLSGSGMGISGSTGGSYVNPYAVGGGPSYSSLGSQILDIAVGTLTADRIQAKISELTWLLVNQLKVKTSFQFQRRRASEWRQVTIPNKATFNESTKEITLEGATFYVLAGTNEEYG